jgi:uncharacterized membrane protein YhaH (DUF805 family)
LDDLAQPTEERQEAQRMSWFIEALKKYAVFSGRSRRMEYWYFVLFVVIITVVLNMLDLLIGANTRAGVGVLSSIFSLAVLIPSIAVSVRRLHDIDRTGWWVLISLVPLVGWIVLLVFSVQEGTPGSNRYGPNPKSASI